MKRIISVLLCMALLLSAMPAASAAGQSSARSEIPATVTGANGIGVLLAKELEEADEAETGEYVSSLQEVTVEDGAATVLFSATEDAELVVAIYEEESDRLVASGTVSVSADDTKATVLLDDAAAIPQYFRAEAFLLSPGDHTPLCDSLSTPLYTRAFQELLASTAEDFEEDRVLNLDEDAETNFAVYGEDVKRSQSDETSNTIVSADDTALRYVIEHPDSTVTSLQPGDFWSCEADGEILIVKVSSVTIEGDRAILLGQETSMEEVFDYAKIEGGATSEDAVIDPSQTADGVTYNGITDMSDTPAKRAWSGEDSLKTGWSFTLSKELEVDDWKAKLSISLDLSINTTLKYYLAKTDSYVSLTQNSKMDVKGTLENKLKLCEIPLMAVPIIIPVCGIVNIELEPNFVAEFSASVSVEMSAVWSLGLMFEQGKGFKNTSTSPTTESELSIEGKLFIGLSFKVKFCIITSYIFDIAISAEAGVEIAAKLSGREREDGLLHECYSCLDGTIHIVFKLKAALELFKFLKLEAKLAEYRHLLGDFYLSNTFGEYGWGDCPHWVPEGEEPTEATEPTEDPGEYDYSGTCGENLIWKLNVETGVLIISGTGDMTNWGMHDSVPWYPYKEYIKDVVIPSGVTSIGGSAFYSYSGITNITIPNSVTSIGRYAFFGCTGLTSIMIPESVTNIGDRAFNACAGLESISVSTNNPVFDSRNNCNAIIKTSTNMLVAGCKNTSIPESVNSIGNNSFNGCSGLTEIVIPNSVTSIGDYAFRGCTSLKSIIIPDSVSSISACLFYECAALENVTLPVELTSIGNWAFRGCAQLKKIAIPYNVTNIGDRAFYGCTRLCGVYFFGDAPIIQSSTFYNVTATAYYPAGNSSWTDTVMKNYGGTLTWISWTPARGGMIPGTAHTGAADAAETLRGLHTGTQDGSAVCFDGLSAGARYVLIVAKEQTDDLLAADNLLYIAQATAAEDGALEFVIAPKESPADVFIGLFGEGGICLHVHTSPEQKAATCTEDGYERTICSDCGEVISEEILPALGHDFADGVCTVCGAADPDYKPIAPGDVNGDGEVDTIDSIRMAKFLVDLIELTDEQKLAADVNGDGDVTTTDAIRLAKYLVGLIESLEKAPVTAAPRAGRQ